MSGIDPKIDKFSFLCGVVYYSILAENGMDRAILSLQLEEQGADRDVITKVIETLKHEGDIYDTEDGFLKALWDLETFKLEEVVT